MLNNWARMTSTTTGTGALALSSVAGWPQFNDVVGLNRYCSYAILNDSDGTPVEAGIGHLSVSTTLVRDYIIATYTASTYTPAGAAAVSLAAGTYRVICTGFAENFSPTIPAVQGAFGQKLVIPNGVQLASNTKLLNGTTIFLSCLQWGCAKEITALACSVNTANGAVTDRIRLGIYATKSDGTPGNLIVSTGDIDPSTTGFKTAALLGGNIKLPPGYYWFAIGSTVAPIVTAGNAGSPGAALAGTPMGMAAGAISSRYGFAQATVAASWTSLPSTLTLTSMISIVSDYPPTVGALVA